jgi:hypothetical protein
MTAYLVLGVSATIALVVLTLPPNAHHMTWWQWRRHAMASPISASPRRVPNSVPPSALLVGLALVTTGCATGAIVGLIPASRLANTLFWTIVIPQLLLGTEAVVCGALGWWLRVSLPEGSR